MVASDEGGWPVLDPQRALTDASVGLTPTATDRARGILAQRRVRWGRTGDRIDRLEVAAACVTAVAQEIEAEREPHLLAVRLLAKSSACVFAFCAWVDLSTVHKKPRPPLAVPGPKELAELAAVVSRTEERWLASIAEDLAETVSRALRTTEPTDAAGRHAAGAVARRMHMIAKALVAIAPTSQRPEELPCVRACNDLARASKARSVRTAELELVEELVKFVANACDSAGQF